MEKRPRYFGVVAALVLLLGSVLRLWRLGAASLWLDEVWTDLSTNGSVHQTLVRILELGNQTPIYFVALHLFPRDTEFLLRLPSALFGIIGIALMMAVTLRLYQDYDLALWAGALLAFNPYHIWLSRTARPYAMLFVFSLLASYYFVVLLRDDHSRRDWVLFVLFSTAAYMTHYFAVALPLAQYVIFAFVLRRKRRFFRRWMVAQVIAGLPLIVWIYALSRQDVVSVGIGWIPAPNWKDPFLTLWSMTLGYDGGMRLDGSMRLYVPLGLLAGGVGLAVGAYDAVQHRNTNRLNFYWFWLVIIPIVFVFVLALFRSLYVDRYFTMFLPAVLLLMLLGWKRLPRWGTALAAIFMITGLFNVFVTFERDENEVQDWRSAATYVTQERQPGDALLVETPVDWAAFHHYFSGENMEAAWLIGGPDNVQDQYDQPVQRVWVIYRNPGADVHRQGTIPRFDPFAKHDSPLYGWLRDHRAGVVSREQKDFNGITVLLVETGDEFAKGRQ